MFRTKKNILFSILLVFALAVSSFLPSSLTSKMGLENIVLTVKAAGATQETATNLPIFNVASSDFAFDVSLSETDDVHWYKVVVPVDGIISFRLMSYFNSLNYTIYNSNLSMTFADSSYWPIRGSASSPQTKTLGSYVLSRGTYYIKLRGTGRYKVGAYVQEYFSNVNVGPTTYDAPTNMNLNTNYIGDFTLTDDNDDWYKFSVPNGQYYVISMTSYFSSLSYRVYNQNLSQAYCESSYWPVGGTTTSPGTKNEEVSLTPGTYYIKLWGGTGKYVISVSPLSQGNCKHDYQYEKTSASYFNQGYTTHTCKKCGYSYVDDYVDQKKLNSTSFNKYNTVSKRKKVKLSWSTVYEASGYEIEYSANKSFKKAHKVTVKGQSKYTTTIKKKLKKNKKFYFRIRAYVKDGDKIAYSDWSKKYKVKVK